MFLFTKENAYGLVRTVVTFAYGWLLSLVPAVSDLLTDAGIDESLFVLLFGGLLYQLVRWVAEKVPAVGYLLIFNRKPDYGV